MSDHGYLFVRLGDIISVTAMIGSVFHQLPDIAAMFTIVWTSIRIYETDTVKKWRNRD
jgi:hypothetical protein